MVEKLRQDPSKVGMVQALSWFISKHSVGIYSGEAADREPDLEHRKNLQAELDKIKGPELVEKANGPAEVETFTLFHDREGQPVDGVVLGRLRDQKRFLAKIEADQPALATIVTEELIGTDGSVRCRDGLNYYRP